MLSNENFLKRAPESKVLEEQAKQKRYLEQYAEVIKILNEKI